MSRLGPIELASPILPFYGAREWISCGRGRPWPRQARLRTWKAASRNVLCAGLQGRVNTSSSSRTRRLSTWLPGEVLEVRQERHAPVGGLVVLIGYAYSRPCSNFSWQAIQCLAHGTASNRFCCISSWQLAQTPYASCWMRFRAASIRFKSERSVLVIPKRNSLV